MLTPDERTRYARHLLLPQVGPDGQEKLKKASVLVVGAGGLGSPVALYLAAAGVGHIGLVDFDTVDATNLQRQILYGTSDVGRPKLEAAKERLQDLNPHIRITTHESRLSSENALDLISVYDIIADGTDNFPTRYLVNDACVLSGKPNVYASIFRFDGQVSIFGARGEAARESTVHGAAAETGAKDAPGPCYRCLFPEPPPPGTVPSCAEGGVLGVLPGIVGTLQAAEVIKLICGIGEPLVGRLLMIDVLDMSFRTLKVQRNKECPVCGESPDITRLIDYEAFCGVASRQGAEIAAPPITRKEPPASDIKPQDSVFSRPSLPSVTVQELKRRRDAAQDFLLLDVRAPEELAIADIGGTVIPMDEIQERLDEIEPFRDKDIVVMCRSGARSARVVQFLRKEGFDRAVNLEGGILAWSRDVDPKIPPY